MAVLHEGGDPKEFMESNAQKLEELKKQKNRNTQIIMFKKFHQSLLCWVYCCFCLYVILS